MDLKLPIYKAPDSQQIARIQQFVVNSDDDTTITIPTALVANSTYKIDIEYYTDADFVLSLVLGSNVTPLTDEGTHKVVSATFTPTANTSTLTFRLTIDETGTGYAYITHCVIRLQGSETDNIRHIAEKWEFHDDYMGQRYVTLNANSYVPIDWKLGDYLVYRGQTYYLNNVPSVTQNARAHESGDSFVYENVRFDDEQGKLVTCMILDVTPTTGDYIASLGTNYTGSSVFTLYCAETTVTMVDEHGVEHLVTLSPVAYLGGVIQANLNRLYPHEGWRVEVNPDIPHLEDKVISINQWYVTQGLAEIHNQWKVDYVVVGRTIRIGYTLGNITGNENEAYMFGYGEGYARRLDDGKSLFRIKRTANQSQNIITRLRAMGSTRNMPYRYYNDNYSLPQAMYVMNLQLPDTFLPMTGTPEHKRVNDPNNKTEGNANRDAIYGYDSDNLPNLRHVLGDSNDAYIDKHDDAANCPEGIREGAAMWDGSNEDLEEIYPTIKSGTYLDLRTANIPDMDGRVPSQQTLPTDAYPNYDNDERIDELLGVDEETNIGDGVIPAADVVDELKITRHVEVPEKTVTWNGNGTYFEPSGTSSIIKDAYADTLFEIDGVSAGKYHTEPVTQNVKFYVKYNSTESTPVIVRYRFRIWQTPVNGGTPTMIVEHKSPAMPLVANSNTYSKVDLPSIPNVDSRTKGYGDMKLEVTENSNIKVTFSLEIVSSSYVPHGTFTYKIDSDDEVIEPEYVWAPQNIADTIINTPFSVFIKDIGVDLANISTTGTDAIIHFNTGACGGMEFKWNPNTATPITIGNKKGWKIDIVERFTDDTIHAYYPNSLSPLAAGDQYVLLNIEFPDAYIRMAEVRLLVAATQYLADNCEQKYTYEPEISDVYIQHNIDNCEKAGIPNKSVYWNLYAGYKFSMRGIPDTEDAVLPVIDNVTIKSVTIREGEQDTPKVEVVLNDEVEQSTLQKITTTVDRIYNGFITGTGGGGINYSTLVSLLNSEGSKLFLSRREADTAKGIITFEQGIRAGEWSEGASGAAIWKDGQGNWHFESDFVNVRKKLSATELDIQEIYHVGGQQMLTAAAATCAFVRDMGDNYRCYFLRVDSNGKEITNLWKVNDQARCQTFNLSNQNGQISNHYYWRLVTGTSATSSYDEGKYSIDGEYVYLSDYHWIDLSKADCDTNSDSPLAGDNIVQLGYRGEDNPGRQNAIFIAGAGESSPYIRQFVGINTFSLPAPETQIKPGDNLFTGKVTMQSGTKLPNGEDVENVIDGLTEGQAELREDIDTLDTGNTNMLRNTGFTGDYENEDVAASDNISSTTEIYSSHLKYWTYNNVTTAQDTDSASGMAATLTNGLLMQEVADDLEYDAKYCVSLKAKGTAITISFAGHEETITLGQDARRVVLRITCKLTGNKTFKVSGSCTVMEIMLTKGTIPNTDWLPSPLDNNKALAYYQNLAYLANAIANASTTILGGLILTQMIRVGNYRNGAMLENGETGGMSGVYSSEQSPFLWGGGSMEQAFYTIAKYAQDPSYQPTEQEVAQMAKFVVTHGGRAILNDIVLRGYVYAFGGYFKGEINALSGVFKSIHSPNNNFQITEEGDLICQNAKISGNMYMPLFEINDSNYMSYLNPMGTMPISYALLIDKSGLNVQINIDTAIPQNITVELPHTVDYNGAKMHLLNSSSVNVTIHGGTSSSSNVHTLAPGDFGVFICYHAGSGANYNWMKIN